MTTAISAQEAITAVHEAVSVQQITRNSVLAAIRAGAHTRDDLAARFEVLSSSRWLADALAELTAAGRVVEDEHGRLTAHGEQLTLTPGRCLKCGLKPWDADGLQPGDRVCTCNNDFEEI